MLEFSYKCPVTFEGKMCFLGQTGGQGLCLTYIGVTSDFHVLASDRWQHTGKITFGPTDIQVGGIIYLGAGQQTLLCLNSETVVFHLFCLHGSYACVSDFDFYKHGSSKGWVIKKAKKKKMHVDSQSKYEQCLLILIFYYSLCTILFLAFA